MAVILLLPRKMSVALKVPEPKTICDALSLDDFYFWMALICKFFLILLTPCAWQPPTWHSFVLTHSPGPASPSGSVAVADLTSDVGTCYWLIALLHSSHLKLGIIFLAPIFCSFLNYNVSSPSGHINEFPNTHLWTLHLSSECVCLREGCVLPGFVMNRRWDRHIGDHVAFSEIHLKHSSSSFTHKVLHIPPGTTH